MQHGIDSDGMKIALSMTCCCGAASSGILRRAPIWGRMRPRVQIQGVKISADSEVKMQARCANALGVRCEARMELQLHRADSSGIWNSSSVPSACASVEGVLHHRELHTAERAPLRAVSPFFCNWSRAFKCCRSLCCFTLFLGLLAANAPCQVISRPATVQLIAQVETIGVSIVPSNERDRVEEGLKNEQQQLSVKTSWAVPPNFSRLRLMESLSTEHEDDYDRHTYIGSKLYEQCDTGMTGAGGNSRPISNPGELSIEAATHLLCGELWTQPSGSTNLANARVDQIRVARHGDEHLKDQARSPVGLLTLTLEAF